MINLLKQLIDLIKNVTNYAMKNKVFRYLYKSFLFISSLYIVKISIIFWRYTRKIWSLLSAVLLLVIADFNFSNIITAFSLILSSLPSHINNLIQNIWSYLNNKIYDNVTSKSKVKTIPEIYNPTISSNRTKITEILTEDNKKIVEYEYNPSRRYKIYHTSHKELPKESIWDNYNPYVYGSLLIIIIVGGITYYYYGNDIRSFMAPYLAWWFKKVEDRDPDSESIPTGGSMSGNEEPSSSIVESLYISDSSDSSDTPSSQSASP